LAPGARILCPHPGEFEALSGIPPSRSLANPAAILSGYASSVGSVVILKSHVTWIASPDGRIAVWEGLEAGLGTAGSGDVLAGLAGGFLAALSAPAPEEGGPDLAFRAACAAVIVHGLAGRAARARRGWFTAADLAEEAALLASRASASSLDPPSAFL
jgi:NAD(P)H-hydrate epimerase